MSRLFACLVSFSSSRRRHTRLVSDWSTCALPLSTRWIRYQQLAWQANVVGLCALIRAFFYNYDVKQKLYGPISLRVFTISLVAAGVFLLSPPRPPREHHAPAPALPPSLSAYPT